MNIDYIGEQPFWGQFGHFCVVVACITALFGVVASYFRVKSNDLDQGWKSTARVLYFTHFAAVMGIFWTLLLMMINHRFEYQYVWQHSKRDLNMNYILAALWEGQEGSTLLWLTWHSVIGLFILRKGGEWEAPVLGIVSLVQVFLSMMLLGFYFGDTHIGSSPFTLIRLREENIGLPWTQLPDYLSKIPLFHDGRGLNPLLQNYWMTIHPPTLFLGFALTTVPFAYAIAGLWTGKIYTWQKPALVWAFIGIMILGTGILMGGAWAYESLSFGGFWAWDPVENASLVPWLMLVGAAHVMLIYKLKGRSLFTTFLLTIGAFLLVVYSTFLTKSGILSKTSVHAFTEDGLNEELTAYMGFFLWLSVCFLSRSIFWAVLYTALGLVCVAMFWHGAHGEAMLLLLFSSVVVLIIGYKKHFPNEEKEEELWSREFWMFVGSLVLIVASIQIIFYTSTPVVNKFLEIDNIHNLLEKTYDSTHWDWTKKLAEHNIAPDKNVIHFYNSWQSVFAIFVTLLMAVGQFFKYRKSKLSEVLRSIMWPAIIALVVTVFFGIFVYFNGEYRLLRPEKKQLMIILIVLIFTSVFSVAANAAYWRRIVKGGIRKAGASIAHIGFGILLLGAVISTSKKNTISANTSGIDVRTMSEDASNEENIYLRRGDTLPMGDYMVTYSNRLREVRNGTNYVLFNVDFMKRDGMKSGEKVFSLRPFIQLNEIMGNAAEPDTRHYLQKDIYSFVKFAAPDAYRKEDPAATPGAYDTPRNNTISRGDTIFADNAICILDSIVRVMTGPEVEDTNVVGIAAHFHIIDRNLQMRQMVPAYFANKKTGILKQREATDEASGTKLVFWKVRPENGNIDVYSSTKVDMKPDFVVIEVSEFPAINVLWIGCLIMVAGTFIAVRERIRKNKISDEKDAPETTMNTQEIFDKADELFKDLKNDTPDEKA